jgi:hypothetical protein
VVAEVYRIAVVAVEVVEDPWELYLFALSSVRIPREL